MMEKQIQEKTYPEVFLHNRLADAHSASRSIKEFAPIVGALICYLVHVTTKIFLISSATHTLLVLDSWASLSFSVLDNTPAILALAESSFRVLPWALMAAMIYARLAEFPPSRFPF